jgi:DNA-binding NarL/FixJ family response regulator
MLVDDHEVVRVGLRSIFEIEDDIEVVGEAANGTEALSTARAVKPDVLLLDVRLGSTDGIETCREVKSQLPDTAVVMLTSFGTDEAILGALVAGASGFLLKNTGRQELLRAVRLAAQGQSLLDAEITGQVTRRLVELLTRDTPRELAILSEREREVLALIAQGMTNRQIASSLVISEATARNHVSHILEKLGLSRRTEAAALASRLGLGAERGPNHHDG